MASIVSAFTTLLFFVLCLAEISFAQTYVILAFGDSITQGLKRDSEGTIYAIVSPPNGERTSDGYEPDLENEFSDHTSHEALVYNWGYWGERSYQGVNRIDSVLDSRVADFILIMEGANDLYEGVSAATTKANLQIMIEKSRLKNTLPIIATITPNTARYDGDLIPVSYNPAIKDLAVETEVALSDQYEALVVDWTGYNSGDNLHLNDVGEQVVARTWFETILDNGLISPNPETISIVPILNLLLD